MGIINSVGTAHFSSYESLSLSKINQINNINVNSLHYLLKLQKNLQKNKFMKDETFFVNISSITARHPHSYSTVYAATKAYISNLIEGVSQERKNTTFLDVRPWFVKTKMVKNQNTWDTALPE